MDNKTCVQEITAHRKKFDESILDVAFHPSRPFIASAGADALAKVFVWENHIWIPSSLRSWHPLPTRTHIKKRNTHTHTQRHIH